MNCLEHWLHDLTKTEDDLRAVQERYGRGLIDECYFSEMLDILREGQYEE